MDPKQTKGRISGTGCGHERRFIQIHGTGGGGGGGLRGYQWLVAMTAKENLHLQWQSVSGSRSLERGSLRGVFCCFLALVLGVPLKTSGWLLGALLFWSSGLL